MGAEIDKISFTKEEYQEFFYRLRKETAKLMKWFQKDAFEYHNTTYGLELEAWLMDKDKLPAPKNETFLDQLNKPLM